MVEGIITRLPPWYRDDLLVKAFNDEIEQIKLEKYYKTMCQHVIQPIQVWREINSFNEAYEPDNVTLYARVFSSSQFPIKSIKLHDEKGIILKKVSYPKRKKVLKDLISFNNTISPISTELDLATVTLTFTGYSATENIVIPIGTEVISSINPDIRFRTIEQDLIHIGETNVTISAICSEEGIIGNVNANTLTILSESIQNITSVTNEEAASGGKGVKGSSAIEQFYVEVEYHGIGASKKVGFPQTSSIIEGSVGLFEVSLLNTTDIIELTVDSSYNGIYHLSVTDGTEIESYSSTNPYSLANDVNENSNWIHVGLSLNEEENEEEYYEFGGFQPDAFQADAFQAKPKESRINLRVIDPVYATNSYLDNVVRNYGITRRQYRTSIRQKEYLSTYPQGYPYQDEQDYYLERRLLHEYMVQDVVETVDLDLINATIRENIYEAKMLNLTLYKSYGSLNEMYANIATGTDTLNDINEIKGLSSETRVYSSSEWAEEGWRSIKVITPGSTADEGVELGTTTTSYVSVEKGDIIRASMHIKGEGAVYITLQERDESGTIISGEKTDVLDINLTDSSQKIDLKRTLTSENVAYVNLYVRTQDSAQNITFYIDNVILNISNKSYYSLLIQDENIDTIERTEKFTQHTIYELIEDINENSQWITTEFIQETNLETSVSGTIQQTGRFKRFGTLKTEIYQKLGVIPQIKDMSDYLLKYNIDNWNEKWWGGGIYSSGVFFVEIPMHDIPSNFIIAPIDELQEICDKSKAFGTYAFPEYVVEAQASFSFESPFYHVPTDYLGAELPALELTSRMSSRTYTDEYGTPVEDNNETIPSIGFFASVTDIYEECFSSPPILNFDEPFAESSLLMNLSAHDSDADFAQDILYSTVSSSGVVSIDNSSQYSSNTPTTASVSGTGLNWDSITNSVDSSTSTYSSNNVGSGNIVLHPSIQSQSGTTGLDWVDRSNVVDSSSDTYAYSEEQVYSTGSQGYNASTIQTNADSNGMPYTNQWYDLSGSGSLTKVEVQDSKISGSIVADTGPYYRKTHILRTTGFNFSIPSSAVIKGVQVYVRRQRSGTVSYYDERVKLAYNGSEIGANKGETTQWASSFETKIYGGETDLWSATLTPSMINSNSFGVDVAGYNNSSYYITAYLDYIGIKVYYQIGTEEVNTKYLNLSGMNFTIPSGSVISGVKVDALCSCTNSDKTLEASIVAGGTTKTKTRTLPQSKGTLTFGGGTDMWNGLFNNFTSLDLKFKGLSSSQIKIFYVTVTIYTSSSQTWTKTLEVSNFGFSIPTGSKIVGVEAISKCYSSSADKTSEISITSGGITKTKTDTLPSTITSASVGGSSDIWGGLPTSPSNYNNGITLKFRADAENSEIRIYYIIVKIYYKLLSGTLTSEIDAPSVTDEINEAYSNIATGTDTASNTTGISGVSSAEISSSTDWSMEGSRSIKVVTPGNITAEGVRLGSKISYYLPVTFEDSVHASMYIKGEGAVYITLQERDESGNALSGFASHYNVNLSSTPVKVELDRKLESEDVAYVNLYVRTRNIAQNVTFYIDKVAMIRSNKIYGKWDNLNITQTVPANTLLTWDILKASNDEVLLSNKTDSNIDLTNIPFVNLKIRANFSTSVIGTSPSLDKFQLRWQAVRSN